MTLYYQRELQDYDKQQEIVWKTTHPKDHAQMTNSNVDKKESEFWKQVRSTTHAFMWCYPIQPQLGACHR
jgi:hypothetical protein